MPCMLSDPVNIMQWVFFPFPSKYQSSESVRQSQIQGREEGAGLLCWEAIRVWIFPYVLFNSPLQNSSFSLKAPFLQMQILQAHFRLTKAATLGTSNTC